MESNEKERLTVHQVSAAHLLAALVDLDMAKFSTTSPNVTLADIVIGAECYEVQAAGVPVLHYLIKRLTRINGKKDGFILAAGGKCKGVDLTHVVLPYIEKQLSDCDWIELHTKRKALAMKASRHGYKVTGFKLGKRLK